MKYQSLLFNRDGRVMGILEVARSIGDGRFKHCGVTCIPEVKRGTLTKNDKYALFISRFLSNI